MARSKIWKKNSKYLWLYFVLLVLCLPLALWIADVFLQAHRPPDLLPIDPEMENDMRRRTLPIVLGAMIICVAAVSCVGYFFYRKRQKVEVQRLELLQDLAHDLRTPLASMKLMLYTLKRKIEKGIRQNESVANLDKMHKEAEYIGHLVDDLLYLALLENPNTLAERQELVLVDIIEKNVVQMEQASGKKIVLDKQNYVEKGFWSDSLILERMLRNVLQNAVSFARESVSVELRNQGDKIVLRILDDGPGFSEEQVMSYGKKRSTRFLRAEDGQRASLGLGSVIVRRIVELHNGSLNVSNRGDGAGAALEITLPA